MSQAEMNSDEGASLDRLSTSLLIAYGLPMAGFAAATMTLNVYLIKYSADVLNGYRPLLCSIQLSCKQDRGFKLVEDDYVPILQRPFVVRVPRDYVTLRDSESLWQKLRKPIT